VATANDLGVGGLGFFQSSEMPLGNNKDMRRRLRANVFESEDVLIFVNFLGRNFTADNAAEKATRVVHAAHLRKP
jgi:hypothetical protein